jgi:hypothetical protein
MRWHRISEDLVFEAVSAPDWEEPSAAGRINRWKKISDRFLRVTCRDEGERVLVITAVFKRHGNGKRG